MKQIILGTFWTIIIFISLVMLFGLFAAITVNSETQDPQKYGESIGAIAVFPILIISIFLGIFGTKKEFLPGTKSNKRQ